MSTNLLKSLAGSKIFSEYERAFSGATGLAISLDEPDPWRLPVWRSGDQNEFCALMEKINLCCAACLRTQGELKERAREKAASVMCEMEMLDSAVPVKLGEELMGFLQIGQVFCKAPTAAQFRRVAARLADWGVPVTPQIEAAYFKTRVMEPEQYEAIVGLLSVFSGHLSILANRIAVRGEHAESPVVTRAKNFIEEHQTDELSLGQVARATNTSTFYFCKIFKKATGLSFTEYLARVRIEKAKALLLSPHRRVSEIAYEVGFQSLTHFNRKFRKIAGMSPTAYRAALVE
jgi:AraC-like DNA-binding protein/ligand-binding sensor protein